MPESGLSPDLLSVLEAVADRIVPADDYPSAWGAGVGDYLNRLLTAERRFIKVYQMGLTSIEAESFAATGHSFPELPAGAQDDLLRQIEAGVVHAEWAQDPKVFFATLTDHIMEGYYADPGNGGNRDGISWKMIGFTVTA